ncbi:DUF6415 family natural product biosynthesis protein [Streptomyces sp. NPDC050636]|uniref:DUF6415 family natural product biosynthesis protein n=1 Tax=Streptomyces sp. NPDC050636 TaxID=3154510 RepID=UPI003441FE6A
MDQHASLHRNFLLKEEIGSYGVDIRTILRSLDTVLAEDAPVPRHDELEDVTLFLRGHIALLIPEVEELAWALPKDDSVRCAALAGVREAQRKTGPGAGAGSGLMSALRYAQQLARVCRALVHHYGQLQVMGEHNDR